MIFFQAKKKSSTIKKIKVKEEETSTSPRKKKKDEEEQEVWKWYVKENDLPRSNQSDFDIDKVKQRIDNWILDKSIIGVVKVTAKFK